MVATLQKVSIPPTPSTDGLAELRQQHGYGPVEFTPGRVAARAAG